MWPFAGDFPTFYASTSLPTSRLPTATEHILSCRLTFITAAGAASASAAESAEESATASAGEKKKIIDKYQFDALPAFFVRVHQQYDKQHLPDADWWAKCAGPKVKSLRLPHLAWPRPRICHRLRPHCQRPRKIALIDAQTKLFRCILSGERIKAVPRV